MLRDLREHLVHEKRVRNEFRDDGFVVQIAGGQPPRVMQAVFEIGLKAPDPRTAKVLALLTVGRDRHIRNRIRDAVGEPCRTHRDVAHRIDVDAQIAADEALRTELVVRQREHRANRELPIQLVERRRAETGTEITPDAHPIRHVIQRRRARADHRVLALGQGGIVVGGRQAGRDGGLEVVRVVIAPCIDTRAERHLQLGDGRDHVLHEGAEAPLSASGHPFHDHLGADLRVEHVFLTVAVNPSPVGAGRQELGRVQGLRPLHETAGAVGRDPLVQRHAADAPRDRHRRRGGNGQKVAPERFEIGEQARLEIALIGQQDPGAAARVLPTGAVRFLGAVERAQFPVVAIFGKVAAADEDIDPCGRVVIRFHAEVPEIDGRVVVDASALAGRDNREAVGPEDAPVHGDAEPPPHVAGEEIGLWTLSIAVLRLEIDRAARRTAWHDADDAAHRVVAVQAGARSVHDLDAVGALERHARPIHPAAKRIVEGHAVEQHERPAHAARTDAAQRHALRRGMRRQAARPPEEAERRNLPQHIVGDDRRRLPDFLAAQNGCARRHVAQALLGFSGRHRHRFEEHRRFQDNLDVAAAIAVAHPHRLLGEAARPYNDAHVAFDRHVDRKTTVRSREREMLCTRRRLGNHRSAGNNGAAWIAHHAV